jgi:hypothetical protein
VREASCLATANRSGSPCPSIRDMCDACARGFVSHNPQPVSWSSFAMACDARARGFISCNGKELRNRVSSPCERLRILQPCCARHALPYRPRVMPAQEALYLATRCATRRRSRSSRRVSSLRRRLRILQHPGRLVDDDQARGVSSLCERLRILQPRRFGHAVAPVADIMPMREASYLATTRRAPA